MECDYTATRADLLKSHKESKHEGIRYPCSDCDYASTRVSDLKRHKESKHEGILTWVTWWLIPWDPKDRGMAGDVWAFPSTSVVDLGVVGRTDSNH